MKYKNVIPFLLFATGLLVCSCQRELSCEGSGCLVNDNDGQAKYSLLQINGDCAHAIIQGTYLQGVVLNDSNAVAFEVNVTRAGAYLFKTDTVNGFYFIGQGIISDTGIVTLVLKGTGKPLSAGNYRFITGPVPGCSFTVSVDTSIVVEKYFYDFKLSGVQHTLTLGGTDGLKNTFSSGVLSGGISNGTFVLHSDGSTSETGLYITKGYISVSDVSESGLASFFAVGSYSYSTPMSYDNIVIIWPEKKDVVWMSNHLPGTQNGSKFIITSVETYTDAMGRPIAKVKASFNCILYDQNGGFRSLTDGRFYGEFANILR